MQTLSQVMCGVCVHSAAMVKSYDENSAKHSILYIIYHIQLVNTHVHVYQWM